MRVLVSRGLKMESR